MDVGKTVHWLLLALVAAYLITGLGIAQSGIIQPLTLGLLGKALSFQIHSALLIPFVAVLLLHLYLVLSRKKVRRRNA